MRCRSESGENVHTFDICDTAPNREEICDLKQRRNRMFSALFVPLLMPFFKILSTPKRAARVITKILIDASGQTGVYYDEVGHPMQGSSLVRDPKFQIIRRHASNSRRATL